MISPRRILTLSAVLAAVTLTGCASMSPDECRHADWYQQGVKDAMDGAGKDRLNDNREACAKVGVVPNVKQYMLGYDKGVRQFCTPENGARWGRAGRYYQGQCPADLDSAFRTRYQAGKAVNDAESNLNRLRSQQDDKQRKLSNSKDDGERKRLREDLNNLDRQLSNARYDLDRAERRLMLGY